MLVLLCILMQGAQSVSSYWIVWWEKDEFSRPPSTFTPFLELTLSGFYMAIFATLGVTQAIMTLCLGFSLAFFNYFASRNLHKEAVHKIVRYLH